jgi:hypothetical protein
MARITRGDVTELFHRFCKVYNLRTTSEITGDNTSKDFYKEPFISLEFYQGYRITIVNTNSSESYFDSAGRKTASEMCAFLSGLLQAKDMDNFKRIQL